MLGRISSLLPWRWRVDSSESSIHTYQTTRSHNLKGRNLDIRSHKKSWYHVHYCFHKSPATDTMLWQTNYPTCSYEFKINFNIILQCTPRSSQRSLSFRHPHQNTWRTFSPSYVPHPPTWFILLDIRVVFVDTYKNEAVNYALSSICLLTHSLYTQISSSTP